MTDDTINNSLNLKRIKPRYINLFENILLALSPPTLKLYLILRFEADYSQECSSIKRKIKFFIDKASLSRYQVFESLRELEDLGLIQRKCDPGYQSIYWIAQDLHYFSEKTEELKSPEIDQPPVCETDGVVCETDGVVCETDNIIINTSTNLSHSLKPLVDFQSTSYKDDKLFMLFYSNYPNKQKPDIARKSFYKHKPDKAFVEMLIQDVQLRLQNNWFGRIKNMIPHPSSYLNAAEWKGEINSPESPKSTNKSTKITQAECSDAMSRACNPHINQGNIYDQHGDVINALN